MILHKLRISNFQSFGPEPTEISFENFTFLIGPNGSGKTALLQALCRLFSFDPALRRIQASDFHSPLDQSPEPESRFFWIEVDFTFPELRDPTQGNSTIPPNFAHMRIDVGDDLPRIRFRLDATLYDDGEIEDSLTYILDVDADGKPINQSPVPRSDRNNIHIHYLPARRNPATHISYTANSLLGRALRAAFWQTEQQQVNSLTNEISTVLTSNSAVNTMREALTESWQHLHTGTFFTSPQITFNNSEIESLLRHLTVSFTPSHDSEYVDFSRLSDGQQSILYLSLVIAMHKIGQDVISGENNAFDIEKLKPPIFTLIAMEEPENSLSPHYLGRIVKILQSLADNIDGQALIATHSPSLLKRVSPDSIRYMKLDENRKTDIRTIKMPDKESEAFKYIKEAIEAFPELYFSRFVILGEGDSEEIVLPRLLRAKGLGVDEVSISIVPLGGRHVNHFWRLLNDLNIPFVTLLDLDLARYGGGWGRIKYAYTQLKKFSAPIEITEDLINGIPNWNNEHYKLLVAPNIDHIAYLERKNVFFSSPLDLDFCMLKNYPTAYKVKEADRMEPTEDIKKIVLSENYHNADQYEHHEQLLFKTYQKRFKSNSKPVSHIKALSQLSDADLNANMPEAIGRMIDKVAAQLERIPE